MAVAGLSTRPDCCNDAGRPRQPLSLSKPLGLGALNKRHKVLSAPSFGWPSLGSAEAGASAPPAGRPAAKGRP